MWSETLLLQGFEQDVADFGQACGLGDFAHTMTVLIKGWRRACQEKIGLSEFFDVAVV